MADAGHITTVKELGRYSIPGGGINTTGQAVNNKVMVWGTLEGLYKTTGLDLLARGEAAALGLSTLDFYMFEVRQAGVSGTRTNPTTLDIFRAGMANAATGGKIFVIDEVGDADPAEPSDNDLITLNFLAVGDDARAPILT